MIDYVTKCLRLYATFEGRARRSEYWYFYLFTLIASFVAGFFDGMLGLSIISLAVTFGLIIPSIAAACRRMHDVGKSGWFMLIPFYNLFLAVTPGDVGPNQYGPDPKNEAGVGNSEVLDDQLL
ncbi:MAG: uncharacterized membrane protein YhaH (DUF805 family) [Saprospiraceae bacterium]|jgi:uncharacterized membrane protein YhaH (DUF805 family)|tara:strand:- start:52 stop:420 length:369 start_codon:yes stop_codon:yes gene_type:complete